jgi:excisionase family DNA binding protein
VDLGAVSRGLGHSSPELTAQIYDHSRVEDFREQFDRALSFGVGAPFHAVAMQQDGAWKDEAPGIAAFANETRGFKSGRQDLNLRPLGPEAASSFVDGLGLSSTGADSQDISGAGSSSLPDGVGRDGPIRTESWAPVGRPPLLLGVELLLTVKQVAVLLGVCRATVYAMVERGELPHVRLGGLVRIRPDELTAAVARGRS